MKKCTISKVKIGPYEYTVETPGDILTPDNQSAHGYHSFQRQTLQVRTKDHINVQKMALLHEILHACFYPIDTDDEEEIITLLTPVLLAFIKENPKVVKFLQS